MENKIWYLKQINILKSLSQKELMELGDQCAMRKYEAGEKIRFDEADPTIYFLKQGSVRVVNLDNTLIELIEAGEIFGFLFTGDAYGGSSIYAQEHCIVCYLAADRWKGIIGQNPRLSYHLFKWVGFSISRVERRLDTLFFKSTRERIEATFVDLTNRFGKKQLDDWVRIDLRITQDQLAQLTGTSRQNVNSYLAEMREKGMIHFNRRGFNVSPDFGKQTDTTSTS